MSMPFKLDVEYKFYGVDNNCLKLGPEVFEALEDGSDGYRSYLGSIEVKDPKGLTFFRRFIDTVKVVERGDGYFEGYVLVSTVDGHEWLRFGTDNSSDYYPYFVFEYTPRAEKPK